MTSEQELAGLNESIETARASMPALLEQLIQFWNKYSQDLVATIVRDGHERLNAIGPEAAKGLKESVSATAKAIRESAHETLLSAMTDQIETARARQPFPGSSVHQVARELFDLLGSWQKSIEQEFAKVGIRSHYGGYNDLSLTHDSKVPAPLRTKVTAWGKQLDDVSRGYSKWNAARIAEAKDRATNLWDSLD